MANNPSYSIDDQIQLLKNRGMLFKEEHHAQHFLKNISYYRLKGYWWDMQDNFLNHQFKPNTYFEDVIERYNFDRKLRLILFDAIERIEIALRTKMIYFMSQSYGALWYRDPQYFHDLNKFNANKTKLEKEFNYSQEVFIRDHKRRHPADYPESWKILEISTMGTLSKIYKTIKFQLPEKASIAKEMGLNLHTELSSWLEAIVYLRNILAHHSRLFSRNMVKKPTEKINNPQLDWLDSPLSPAQVKKPFLIITSMVYLCNKVTPNHQIKSKILQLFIEHPNVPVYKLGFLNNWQQHSIWSK